jgi:RimJ/RimL family protein N-acetyltransferase
LGHGAQGGSGLRLLDLQSERLTAARWQDLSAAELAALFAPAVVRWLPGGFQDQADDAARRAFLELLSAEAETVALFHEGAGAGLLILSRAQPGSPERHIGYLLAEQAWGKGLASELLHAVQDLFRGSGVVLLGGVMDENAASARVLEKAGFTGTRERGETVYRWDSAAG